MSNIAIMNRKVEEEDVTIIITGSSENFKLPTKQFIILLFDLGGAVFLISWRVRGVEKDVEYSQKRIQRI
jgi:hypothetical protein